MAHRLLRPGPRGPERGRRDRVGERMAMAGRDDALRARIEAYPWPPGRGGVEVVRANRGYTLLRPAHRRARGAAAPDRPGRPCAGPVVAPRGLGQPGPLRS